MQTLTDWFRWLSRSQPAAPTERRYSGRTATQRRRRTARRGNVAAQRTSAPPLRSFTFRAMRCGIYSIINIPGNEVGHLFYQSHSGQWGAAFISSFTFRAMRCGIYSIIHIPGNEVRHLFHHSHSGQWGAAFIPSFTFRAMRWGIYSKSVLYFFICRPDELKRLLRTLGRWILLYYWMCCSGD